MKTDRRKQDLSEMSQLFILLDFYEYIKFRQYFFATEKKNTKEGKRKIYISSTWVFVWCLEKK